MHHSNLNIRTLLKPFSIIVIFGMIYLFLGSDVSRSTHNLGQIGPITPATAHPPPTTLPNCRALFTISHVHHHHLQTPAHNRTHSEDVRGDEWVVGDSAGGKVEDREQLMRKRTFQCGAPTMYYYSLAALLPKLLSFSDDIHYGEEREEKDGEIQTKDYSGEGDTRKQRNSPFFRGRSRVVAGGGVLPYVPCVIASYQQPAAFTNCVRRRLEKKPQLWLSFMGDSKIRNVFTEFINRTDSEYKYTISYLNVTEPWPTLRQRLVNRQVRWCDMEAATSAARGLRISFSFKKMSQTDSSEFNKEIAELWRWASGEPSPDLLVVGYTSWIIGMRNQRHVYTADNLDLLMEKHSVIVPLLEQISRRTRVLVLPQSRIRPHSSILPNMWGGLSDALFDWSEMTFLQLLKQNRESQGIKRATREDSSNAQDSLRNSSKHERLSHPSHNASHRHILPMEEAFRGEPQSYRTSEQDRTYYHSGENETRQQTIILQEDQRSPVDIYANPEHQETTEQTRTPASEETTEQTRTTGGSPVLHEATKQIRIPVDIPVPQEATEQTRIPVDSPIPQEASKQTRIPVDIPVPQEATEQIRTTMDIPVLQEASEQTRTPVDTPVPQEVTEHTRIPVDTQVPQEASKQIRIPIDIPVPEEATEKIRTLVDTPVLQEASEQTRTPVDTTVPVEATEHTRIPWDTPVPQENAEQTKTPRDDLRLQRTMEQAGIVEENPTLLGTTEQTWTFQDQLMPTRSTSGVWWWDSSLPLNLAGILECNQLYSRGLASHPIYQDDVLLCSNLHHSGSATNSDLVTMLLNLLCNSLAGLHHNYCCT